MRVARFDGADPSFPISVLEVSDPDLPNEEWVRVQVAYGGICGSDLHNVYPNGTGTRALQPFVRAPMDVGHEVSGVVVEAGRSSTLGVGQRVTLDPTIGCAARSAPLCPRCAQGAPSACLRFVEAPYGFGTGFCVNTGGGWGTHFLAHSSQLHHVPDTVDDATAALTEPLSVAVHGLRRRLPNNGEPILIVGAGIIGLTSVVAARALCPASEITVLARHPHQTAAALRLGAHHVVRPDDGTEYFAELAALSGGTVIGRRDTTMMNGGYPYVVEAVGTGASVELSFRLCGQRGTVLMIGGVNRVTLDLSALWFKELHAVGTLCHAFDGGAHSFEVAIDMLGRGLLPAEAVVTHTFGLSDLQEACATAADKSSGSIKVLIDPTR